jgi:hypothetical protein
MNKDHFWHLIDGAREAADGNSEDYEPSLWELLDTATPDELIAFEQHFDTCVGDAWRWDLWGAANIVNGGCSHDGFFYFRAWLVMQGRHVYEAALADPDSLVEVCVDTDGTYECGEVLAIPRVDI